MDIRWKAMAGALALLTAGGCATSTTGPSGGDEVEIVLAVSGGIAGVDRQFTIDGPGGVIVGDRCAGGSGCDWTPGDTLTTVDESDVLALALEFRSGGFFTGPTDFGTECCDQFDYTLTYRDDEEERTVEGSDGTLPTNLLELVRLVETFLDDARS